MCTQLSKGLLHLLLFPPQNQSFQWWCYKSMLIWSNQFCTAMKDIHTMCSFTLQTRNQLKQGASRGAQGWSELASLEVVTDPDSIQCRSMRMEWGSDWDAGMRLDSRRWGERRCLGVVVVGVPILFDRCITVWVSLTVLAYMLPMSISHAETGRCWRWRTMWRSLGWNAPTKIHSHQQLLITEPWSLNHSPLS